MILILPLLVFTTAMGAPDSTATVLVESENAFCQAAMTHGIRQAFLTYLADESIVFRPGPVPGRKTYSDSKPTSAVLTWRPVRAELARGGDFGYTTGPWEFKRGGNEPAVAFGQYVSIWRKQADGKWRVILDVGIEHPTRDTTAGEVSFASDLGGNKDGAVDTAIALRSLLGQERLLSGSSGSRGFVEALLEQARDDVRVYRGGRLPVVGSVRVREAFGKTGGRQTWEPTGGAVSRFGDLGYTFGRSESQSSGGTVEHSSYVRIWRMQQDGTWKVVLDLNVPPQ